MDLPRPALVKQIELHLSAEGRRFSYLLHDRASGQILRLTRQAAQAWRQFATAATGDRAARDGLDEDAAKQGFVALGYQRSLRDRAWFGQRRFNPIQMQIPLFDASRVQGRMRGLSLLACGPVGLAVFLVLLLWVVTLGVRNDWAIVTEFRDVFSLEALLTFGLIAPFLKFFHETGHVLAATRFGVRLRRAGINVIGFYPLPYVDCTEADLTATRRQRIAISAAGIVADFLTGMVLFIAWHLVSDGAVQQVLGRAFVFTTFSSLLFNANPLMRMDGYFILGDLLGRRNLGTDAAAALARFRGRIAGRAAPAPEGTRIEAGLTLFGMASFVYRWFVLCTLLWNLLPRYLGVGLLAGAWGAALMLAQPLNAATRAPAADAPPATRRWLIPVCAGLAVLGLAFVPLAPVTVVDLAPDTPGSYALTISRPGLVTEAPPVAAHVAAGAVILRLSNPDIEARRLLAEMGLAEAQLARQAETAQGAAGMRRGAEREAAAREQLDLTLADQARLVISAPRAGQIALTRLPKTGEYLTAGTVIGQLLPDAGDTVLTGAFPETAVQDFERGLQGVTLRDAGQYRVVDPAQVRIAEEIRMDESAMTRSFTLRLTVPQPPSGFLTGGQQARLSFAPEPLWRHGARWISLRIAQFRDAEIAERQRRLETD